MSPQASWCGPRAMRGPDRRGGRRVCRAWPSPLPGTWPRISPARWATPGRGKRRVSGALPRVDAYLLELAAGIVLLAIGNVLFLPHDIGYLGWQPNPALALVAVIAARHGLREGIMAALVTSGLELACRLGPAIPQTARRFLQADACQLYLLDGDVLRLRAAEGAPPPLTELNPAEGLAGLAIRQGKAQSLRDLMTISTAEELQRAPFVMAAPLTGREGALLGCLTVTRLPFLRLNPVALDRLGVVANWAALAVDNARTHERTRA